VPRRHFSLKDMAIDGLGAVLPQLVVWWYAKGKWPLAWNRKKPKLARGQDR
jgi:hypothetical protein